MVLHYDHITQSAVTVSIPRDLFVRSKVVGRAKINEVYSDTRNALNETAATQELLDVVNEVTGRNVTLYAMVDFAGFRKLIDVLGGIDVEVPERLYDNEYPNSSWGYMTVDIPSRYSAFRWSKSSPICSK